MKVSFSERSREDFREIADYLIENAGIESTNRVVDEIERIIFEVLTNNPKIGKSIFKGSSLLSFPAGKYPNYQIYYRLQGDALEIYRVLHGKRDAINVLDVPD